MELIQYTHVFAVRFQIILKFDMKKKLDNITEPQHDAKLPVSRRFFTDVQDFNQYMQTEKPKEIWLDEFMEAEPYIIISFNDGVKFRGVYNHQILLGGDNSDFTWLFESGMYVKTFW